MLRSLFLVVIVSLLLGGCVAGPTPHPSQEESNTTGEPGADPTAPSVDEPFDGDNAPMGGAEDAGETVTDLDASADTAADTTTDTAADVATDGPVGEGGEGGESPTESE